MLTIRKWAAAPELLRVAHISHVVPDTTCHFRDMPIKETNLFRRLPLIYFVFFFFFIFFFPSSIFFVLFLLVLSLFQFLKASQRFLWGGVAASSPNPNF
jgi:hypothetical protein